MKTIFGWGLLGSVLYLLETGLVWGVYFAVLGSDREHTSAAKFGFWSTLAAHQMIILSTAALAAKLLYLPTRRLAVLTAGVLLVLLYPTFLIFGLGAACRIGDCI